MRKYIIACLILTVLCGSALFYVSQRTRDSREAIAVLNRKISNEQEAIRVLKAEWSYLNRPQRLERLSKKFLKIEKTKPYQFVRFEDIEMASNIVIELPEHKQPAPTMIATNVAKKPVRVKKSKPLPIISKFKDRVESLLEDKVVADIKIEDKKQQTATKHYKNSAFRRMIGAWGNE